MTVERLGVARLGSILAPFDGATDGSGGSGISLAIEDPTTRVAASTREPRRAIGHRRSTWPADRQGRRARLDRRGAIEVASVAPAWPSRLSNGDRASDAAATAVRLEAELARRHPAKSHPVVRRRRTTRSPVLQAARGVGGGF
jgi:hypothetical protein